MSAKVSKESVARSTILSIPAVLSIAVALLVNPCWPRLAFILFRRTRDMLF